MKIRISQIERALVIFILSANIMFFSIPGLSSALESICGFSNKKLVVISIFVLLILNTRGKIHTSALRGTSSRIVQYYIAMYLITFLISWISYKVVTIQTFMSVYYYAFAILLYFPLKRMLKSEEDYRWLINTIIIIGTIYSVYMIISKGVYQLSGKIIFDTISQYMQFRNGSLRLARPANFVCISSVFCFTQYLKLSKKQKKSKNAAIKYLILFVIGMVCLLYVSQTRTYYVAFLFCCVMGLLSFYSSKKKVILICALMFCIPLFVPSLQTFTASFYSEENVWGTEIRLSGYAYFLSHMFDNFLCGIGLVSGTSYSSLLTGGKDLYGYVITDMGYTGFLGVFGILGVILLIALFVLFLITYRSFKSAGLIYEYPEVVCIPIFFIIITWSLSFADPQRSLYLPIILSVYGYFEKVIDFRKRDGRLQ